MSLESRIYVMCRRRAGILRDNVYHEVKCQSCVRNNAKLAIEYRPYWADLNGA
jgi:hypothetical protein